VTHLGGVVRFVLLGIAWGSSFLMMKLAVQGLSPGQVVLGRLVLGALALTLLLLVMRWPWPRQHKVWLHLAVTAGLGCVLPFLLFAWAAERIPSGVSSVLNSATPLTTAAVTALALRQEKVTPRKGFGIVGGAAGILVVLSPWRFCAADPIAIPAVQMVAASLMMLVLAPFFAVGDISLTAPVVVGMLLLGVVGTGLAYVWNFRIIAEWGATAASTVAYVTPLVKVVLGAVVLREEVSWNQAAGAAVVIGGIILAQSGPKTTVGATDQAPDGELEEAT
jgi:drug/metabolite transporter (DMT)-like permease